MAVLLWCWLIVCTLIAATWAGRVALLCFIDRFIVPIQPGVTAPSAAHWPRMSAIVAAKDEAENIEACVRSLCAQEYPSLEVIAVNDRSRDATGSILDRLSAELTNLHVLHVESLPDGWFGKNNAMQRGVQSATGDWLFFTDADCVQLSRHSLALAVDRAVRDDVELLSVLPEHQAHTLWERIIQPACSAILLVWFNPLIVNNPGRTTAYANGAFMLFRRDCYDRIEGHAGVRSEINEDMHLARRAKSAGLRLRVQPGRDLYTVRMYGTMREMLRGWTRIFAGSFASLPRILGAIAVLCFFTFAPWLSLAASQSIELQTAAQASLSRWITWSSVAACAMQLGAMALFYSLSRVGAMYGLLYPIGGLAGLGLLINAARYLTGRGTITWRGTTYREGRVQHDAAAAASVQAP